MLSALDKQALDEHVEKVAESGKACEHVAKMELLSSKCDRTLYSFDLEKQLLLEGVLSGVEKLGKLRQRQGDQPASLTDRPRQPERFLDTLGDEQRMSQLRDTFMVGIESATRYDLNAQELSKAASQWWKEEMGMRSRRRLLLQQVRCDKRHAGASKSTRQQLSIGQHGHGIQDPDAFAVHTFTPHSSNRR